MACDAIRAWAKTKCLLTAGLAVFALSTARAGTEKVQVCELHAPGGEPAVDVEYYAFTLDRDTGRTVPVAAGKTDAKGRFSYRFEGQWNAQRQRIDIYARFDDSSVIITQLRGWRPGVRVVESGFRREDLVVRCVASEGDPVSGLNLRVGRIAGTDRETQFLASPVLPPGFLDAVTDAAGRLVLRGVPGNLVYYLEHDDPRYAQLMGGHSVAHWLKPGEEHVVELLPAGSIRGRVVVPDGEPVAGVKVEVLEQYDYDDAGGGGGDTATDAQGRFVVGQLRPATYDVMAKLEGVPARRWAAPVLSGLKLGLGEELISADVRLRRGVRVTGRITNAKTGEPISGEGVTVGLVPVEQSSPLGLIWARAGDDGRYQGRMPAGRQKVYFGGYAEGFERPDPASHVLEVADGEEIEIDFEMKPTATQEQAGSTASSQNLGEVFLKGAVRTEEGLPVTGIEVRCQVLEKPDTSSRFAHQITDDEGRYVFEVPVGFQYRVHVGGEKATGAQSARYTPEPNTDVSVADLVVRPFSARVEGRVVLEDGQAAANLDYGYASKSASPVDARKPPKTDGDGAFVIEHLLPDEPYVFWVFVGETTFHVWRRLDPNVSGLELTLRKRDCIELPPDWRRASTHQAIARDMTYAQGATIDFALPDLNGKVVSLSEIRAKNKAVVVNITGTWCGGCRLEAPYLVDFYKRYKEKGLEVVSVVFEPTSNENPLDAIRTFKQKFNINYALLHGGPTDGKHVESVVKGLRYFGGYPTTLYIDRKGKVRFIHVGFWIGSESEKKWQLELMEGHIRSILSGGEAH